VILARVADGLLVVRQTDHGDQTGLFAQAWGNEEIEPVLAHARSAELAARHHDDGWALWERRPTMDADTDQPYQFLALPPADHLPFYRAAIERVARYDVWAGILVSMHGAGLYNDRYGTFRLIERGYNAEEQALVDEFLGDMQDFQDRLFAGSGHRGVGHADDDPEVRHLYLLLQVWDRLSLQFAFRLAGDGVIEPLPCGAAAVALRCRNDGAFALRLHPYPFADDELCFPLAACVVPDRRYRSPEDFLEAVAAAEVTTLDCRVRADRE